MVSVVAALAFDVQTSLTYQQAEDGSRNLDLQESLSAAVVQQGADGSTHGTAVVSVSASTPARDRQTVMLVRIMSLPARPCSTS